MDYSHDINHLISILFLLSIVSNVVNFIIRYFTSNLKRHDKYDISKQSLQK